MNALSRAYVFYRLGAADSMTALQKVWASLGRDYQNDPEIQAFKDKMKRVVASE